MKVSLSTVKGKRMSDQGQMPRYTRLARPLRLLAFLALVVALAAVIAIVGGASPDRARALIKAACALAAVAFVGMGILAARLAIGQGSKNDRSV